MRGVRLAFTGLAWLMIAPAVAYGQASITGTVRDSSGAVLPGVTVEAASPSLIEKMRSVATDSTGQYRIENLRPGTYTVTFTLAGFNAVKREGIELTGTFTASVDAELQVGALEETITVAGENPIVDVQSTTRERVFNQEIIDAIPMNHAPIFMAALLPGVTAANPDVGGLLGMGARVSGSTTVRGNSDVRAVTNGVSLHSASGGGDHGIANLAAYQEVAIETSGISVEQKESGVRINLIPRDGGNSPRGYFYGTFANDSMQGNNFTQDLKDRGLRTPDSLKKMWDLNPAFGGPIRRDKVWFHATIRYTGANSYVPVFYNRNAGNPDLWTYEPDTGRGPASRDNVWRNGVARITWQATPKNKLAFSYDQSISCECPRTLTAEIAPEASLSTHSVLDPKRYLFGDWTAPVTDRLLLEGAILHQVETGTRPSENIHFITQPAQKMIGVLEQSNNLNYRATTGGQNTWSRTLFSRLAMSYITGAHAFKVGFNYGAGSQDQLQYSIDAPMTFRFNNGVPNQLTLRATPYRSVTKMDADHGLFVQDRFTVSRWTLTLGLRYDYFHDSFPELAIGPGEYVPNRNIVLPAADGVRWHDIQPRSGLALDLFGDRKTALKLTLNKYLAPQAALGTFGQGLSPANRLVTSTTRSWNDVNRNFVPDCDLLSPAANGECGAMAEPNFGHQRAGTTYDPDLLRGGGKRSYNWEFSAGVQREVLSRVSVDIGYFRRWYGNFLVTDNRAVGPSDYEPFSIAAPLDPRLPGGGGHLISGLYDFRPDAFGRPADNFLTLADNYGKQIHHWNGVDVTVSARPRPGVLLQGGTSTGRRTTDNCDVVTKVDNPSPLYCRQQENVRTNVKFLATYTIPRIDVQASGTLQSVSGPEILANYVASNAEVRQSLGRNLAGGARNVTVNLVRPGTMYGERMNQIDLRIGKVLRLGRSRATISLDIYNALNASSILTQSNSFATWQQPQRILNARFAKLVVQLDF